MKSEDVVFKLMGGIFGGLGVLMLIFGIIIGFPGFGIGTNREKVTAEISAVHPSGAEIEYRFHGKKYTSGLNYHTSSMQVGDESIIYVNPDDPRDFISRGSRLLTFFILGGMGLVFSTIGGVFLYIVISANKRRTRLLKEGRKIEATIDLIDWNYSTTVNGMHPLYVVCSYDDGLGHVYKFRSRNIWEDRGYDWYPEKKTPTPITVYVDVNNMKSYYVDPTSIPLASAENSDW